MPVLNEELIRAVKFGDDDPTHATKMLNNDQTGDFLWFFEFN